MARVVFTKNLQRHVDCPPCRVTGTTLRDVLDAAFAERPRARDYVLDERGHLRRHMVIFIDGEPVADRQGLSDLVAADATVAVMQALSGG